MTTPTRKSRRRTAEQTPPPVAAPEPATVEAPSPKLTRGEMLTSMMRQEGGASAAELAASVGWQVHSVRGFVSGTLKKRADLQVVSERMDGATRYRVLDRPDAEA